MKSNTDPINSDIVIWLITVTRSGASGCNPKIRWNNAFQVIETCSGL